MVTNKIISINDILKIKKSIEYAESRNLNPKAYKDIVKSMEALMFIEKLEVKYGCKF